MYTCVFISSSSLARVNSSIKKWTPRKIVSTAGADFFWRQRVLETKKSSRDSYNVGGFLLGIDTTGTGRHSHPLLTQGGTVWFNSSWFAVATASATHTQNVPPVDWTGETDDYSSISLAAPDSLFGVQPWFVCVSVSAVVGARALTGPTNVWWWGECLQSPSHLTA
jgi:hypothetical protein